MHIPHRSPAQPGRAPSLKRRLNGLLWAMLVLAVAASAASTLVIIRLVGASRATAEQVERQESAVQVLRQAFEGEHALAHQYVDFGAGLARAFQLRDDEVRSSLDRATRRLKSPADVALLRQIRDDWNRIFGPLRPLADAGADTEGLRAELGDPLAFHSHVAGEATTVTARLDALAALPLSEVRQNLGKARGAERHQVWLLGSLLASAVVMVGLLGRRVRHDLLRPLSRLRVAVASIGSEETPERLDIGGTEELAALAEAFNAMADRLEASQRDLSREAARTRAVIETASNAFASTDADGRITDWNRRAEELFGWSRDEACGRSVADLLFPPRCRAAHRDRFAAVLGGTERSTAGHPIEVTMVDRSGREFTAEVTAWLVEDDDTRSAHAFVSDITERKRVAELTERMAAVVEFSDEAIVGLEPDLTVTSWNPGAERLYGYSANDALGRHVSFLLPEGVDIGGTVLVRVISGERISGRVTRVRRRDGGLVTVSLSASPILDADGGIIGIASIAHDVTDRQRAEAELRHAQKLESVGQLAAGIAHEINTPIQFVGDNVGFLQGAFADLTRVLDAWREVGDSTDPGAAVDRARRLEHEADTAFLEAEVPLAIGQTLDGIARVATIVKAMKAFGHPSGDEKAEADLNEAVRTTLVVANNQLKYVAEVTTELGDLPPVWCHIGDVNQIILNLVVNAAQAVAETIDDNGLGRIAVRTTRDGDAAVLEVADTGVGIPPDIAERIFEPFFTTKDVGVGTGQGLSLVYSLVHDRHGGTVSFTSTPGQGTIFTVRLPIDPRKAPHPGNTVGSLA